MKEAGQFAIVYDITDDAERRKVDGILRGFGFRVQKSVFECKLTRADLRAATGALEGLKLQTGSVEIYRIYGGSHARVIGQPMVDRDADFAYVY